MRKWALSFGVVALFLMLLGGSINPFPAEAQSKQVKIGVLMPLTGPLTLSGTLTCNGIKLAADEINSKGGVNIGGEKYAIDLVIYDTKCVPKDSATATERLIIRDKVALILGDFCSSCCFVDAPVADKHKTAFITPVCAAGGLTKQGFKYFFRMGVHNFSGVITMMELLRQEGVKKVVLIAINDAWGRSYTELYPPALKEAGFELLGIEYFEHGQKDYYTLLTKAKGMNPDGLLVCAEMEDFAPMVIQARELMPGKKIVETGGSDLSQILKLVGAQKAEGLKSVSRMPPPLRRSKPSMKPTVKNSGVKRAAFPTPGVTPFIWQPRP